MRHTWLSGQKTRPQRGQRMIGPAPFSAIAGSSPARPWPAVTHQQQSVLGTGAGKTIIVVDAVVDDRDMIAGGAQPAADALQHLVELQPQLAPSASNLCSRV
jgi:hypothetical protein